jgi:hypothetical protein
MKQLMQKRLSGYEPDLVQINLTDQLINGGGFFGEEIYTARPIGDIRSLRGLDIVLLVDTELSCKRAVEALNKIFAVGVGNVTIHDIEANASLPVMVNGNLQIRARAEKLKWAA